MHTRLSSTGLADAHLAKSCIISDVDPSSLAELGREFQNEYYHSSATPTISLYSNNCMAFARYVTADTTQASHTSHTSMRSHNISKRPLRAPVVDVDVGPPATVII